MHTAVPEAVRAVAVAAAITALPCGLPAQKPGRAVFYGVVRESSTERPIDDVRVSLSPGAIAATTNANGRFTLDKIPYGRYEIRFERVGYTTRIDTMTVGPGRPVDLKAPSVNNLYEPPVPHYLGSRERILYSEGQDGPVVAASG